jgi:hypothetical protein
VPALDLSTDELLTTTRAVRKRLDLARPVEPEVLYASPRPSRRSPTLRSGSKAVPQAPPTTPPLPKSGRRPPWWRLGTASCRRSVQRPESQGPGRRCEAFPGWVLPGSKPTRVITAPTTDDGQIGTQALNTDNSSVGESGGETYGRGERLRGGVAACQACYTTPEVDEAWSHIKWPRLPCLSVVTSSSLDIDIPTRSPASR